MITAPDTTIRNSAVIRFLPFKLKPSKNDIPKKIDP
jgi:hypothetical protein